MENIDFKSAVAKLTDSSVEYEKRTGPTQKELEDAEFKKLLNERNYWLKISEREVPFIKEGVPQISELYAKALNKITLLNAEMDEFLARPKTTKTN